MMAIGLGKFAGAQRYHTYAYKLGLEHSSEPSAAGFEKRQDSGGLAIWKTPSQYRQLTAVPVDQMEQKRTLLSLDQELDGSHSLPVEHPGAGRQLARTSPAPGMDTKVVQCGVNGESNLWIRPTYRPHLYPASERDSTATESARHGRSGSDRLVDAIDCTQPVSTR